MFVAGVQGVILGIKAETFAGDGDEARCDGASWSGFDRKEVNKKNKKKTKNKKNKQRTGRVQGRRWGLGSDGDFDGTAVAI